MEINPELALAFIQKNASEFAEAKGKRIYLENFLKTVKAQQMNESDSSSLGARETDAYASQQYIDTCLALRQAVEQEERLKWLLTAAQAKIEVWKTIEYGKRAEMRNL